MRRTLLYIAASLMMIAATGCRKDQKPIDCSTCIIGEWCFVPEEFDADLTDVHVSFMSDSSFDLYQKIGDGRYRHYSGRWEVDGTTLSGKYASGEAWGSFYELTFTGTDNMTMTALNGSEDVMKYIRQAIPHEVKQNLFEMKSAGNGDDRPLL